jgi:hypothetical protein
MRVYLHGLVSCFSDVQVKLLRQYSVEYEGTALHLPLQTTALDLAQYSRQEVCDALSLTLDLLRR